MTGAQRAKIIALEEKTHRRLTAGEVFKAGDIYGGADWGFVFTIGTKQVQSPQPGDRVDDWHAKAGYRYRRLRT